MAILKSTRTTTDQISAVVNASTDELSGPNWVDLFPTGRDVTSLEPDFREKVTKFLDALKAAGAHVHINATRRPPERAYLMHWSWMIAKEERKPEDVPSYQDVNIEWRHPILEDSIEAARSMVIAYGLRELFVPPALNSLHIEGQAIDMDIFWSGTLTIKNAEGKPITISSAPKDEMNSELDEIGKSYGVIKFVDGRLDKAHWSTTGH